MKRFFTSLLPSRFFLCRLISRVALRTKHHFYDFVNKLRRTEALWSRKKRDPKWWKPFAASAVRLALQIIPFSDEKCIFDKCVRRLRLLSLFGAEAALVAYPSHPAPLPSPQVGHVLRPRARLVVARRPLRHGDGRGGRAPERLPQHRENKSALQGGEGHSDEE